MLCLCLSLPSTVHPVPYPFLFPCCLPKPIPRPRAFHSHFPFVSAAGHPGFNLMELRESGLPPLASALHASANSWLLNNTSGWDLNRINRSLFGDMKETEVEGDDRALGSDGKREWRWGINCTRTGFPSSNLSETHSFNSCTLVCYSKPLIHRCCIYWVDPWQKYWGSCFFLTAVHVSVEELHETMSTSVWVNKAMLSNYIIQLFILHCSLGFMKIMSPLRCINTGSVKFSWKALLRASSSASGPVTGDCSYHSDTAEGNIIFGIPQTSQGTASLGRETQRRWAKK